MRSLNRLVIRLLRKDLFENLNSSCVVATIDALVKSSVNDLLIILYKLDLKVRKKCVDMLMINEKRLPSVEVVEVLKSIKEVVNFQRSRNAKEESIRSTLISSACGPEVLLKTVSSVFGIYEGNRNHYKLEKYRQRRQAYMSGENDNMEGARYASEKYGFPAEVLDVIKEF